MNEIGKTLVVAGLMLALLGGLLWSGVGRGWVGRLPGDLHYNKGNVSFFFPVASCVLLSLFLSLVLWLLRKM